jgi:hypothetical protein
VSCFLLQYTRPFFSQTTNHRTTTAAERRSVSMASFTSDLQKMWQRCERAQLQREQVCMYVTYLSTHVHINHRAHPFMC